MKRDCVVLVATKPPKPLFEDLLTTTHSRAALHKSSAPLLVAPTAPNDVLSFRVPIPAW